MVERIPSLQTLSELQTSGPLGPVPGGARSGEPLVVGMHDGLAAATIAAGSTDRRLRQAKNLGDIVAAIAEKPSDCLVSGGRELTASDVATLTETALRHGVPLGFVAGWAGPNEAVRHARKLANYEWSAPAETLVWSGFGDLGTLHGSTQGLCVLPVDEHGLAERLRTRRRAVVLASHGNGIDAPVGDVVMCSLANGRTPDPGARFFPCGGGGPCLRARRTDGGLEPPVRIGAGQIPADVVVWLTCWGLLCADSIFDPAYSLAQDFAGSSTTGALITSYKSISSHGGTLLLAAGMLHNGASLGELTLALNRSGPADRPSGGWVLLGDPSARPMAPAAPIVVPLRDHGAVRVRLPGGAFLADLPGQTRLVTGCTPDGSGPPASTFKVWPLPELGVAAGVNLGAGSIDCDLEAAGLRDLPLRVQEVVGPGWRAVESLGFALWFLERCALDPRSAAIGDLGSIAATLEERLQRSLALARTEDLLGVLSGSRAQLDRLVSEDLASWERADAGLFGLLGAYLRTVGGRPDHTYGDSCRRLPMHAGNPCPYCGSPVEVEDLEIPLVGKVRRLLRCLRCTLVADSDHRLSVALSGPASIAPGQDARYRLVLSDRDNCLAWTRGLAGLAFQPVPWHDAPDDPRAVAFALADDVASSEIAVSIAVPPAMPEGVYFLLGGLVASGEIVVVRRPVTVTRLLQDGASRALR